MKPLPVLLALALALSACGVKSDLEMPNGQISPKPVKPTAPGEQSSTDPSKPPSPIGR
jgi:predicted small lipoprotein YifL